MKKIIYFIVALGMSAGVTSCNLNLMPDTDVAGPDAGTLLYVEGLRNGIYDKLTEIQSYAYMRYPDYYTDLFNETKNSSNRGGFFSRWSLVASDQDVSEIWKRYYELIRSINYTLGKADVALEKEPQNGEALRGYKAELRFLRAYVLDQVVLRFCEDYDPAKASSQLGVPPPTSYNPLAKLNRGTLDKTYAQILEDISAAEQGVTTAGAQNSPYVTVDAIVAFKAQIALQMHDYGNAIAYAKSLYNAYPLVGSKADVEKMWMEDSSTETIFQLSVVSGTTAMLDRYAYDYSYGSWDAAAGYYFYNPSYVPENWVCQLYNANKDYRYGTYVAPSHTKDIGDETGGLGILLIKLIGNKNLSTSPTTLSYINMPKIFRVAEMYLIEAEAQYRQGGDALTPLNALRAARGLDPVSTSGDALFKDIQDENAREFIGEGHRLFDLKRWGLGMKRDAQPLFIPYLSGGTTIYQMSVEASNSKWVWPIPQQEIFNNSNFGSQNEGY